MFLYTLFYFSLFIFIFLELLAASHYTQIRAVMDVKDVKTLTTTHKTYYVGYFFLTIYYLICVIVGIIRTPHRYEFAAILILGVIQSIVFNFMKNKTGRKIYKWFDSLITVGILLYIIATQFFIK